MTNGKTLSVFLVTLIAVATAVPVAAQRPGSSRNSLGVDEVKLLSGKKMYGVVVDQDPQRGVKLLVERQWFEKTYGKEYREHLEDEIISLRKSRSRTLARLDEWQKVRGSDEDLVRFIKEEKSRLGEDRNKIDKQTVSGEKFTFVNYSPQEIQSLFIQPRERRNVAGCAWQHDLQRVTIRTTKSLIRELNQEGIEVADTQVDLSDQLPAATYQTDDEWNARVALFEYVFRKELNYQGTGNHLVRIDEKDSANPWALVGRLLGGGLDLDGIQGGVAGQLMTELNLEGDQMRAGLKKTNWWKSATSAAENDGYRGVKITRVNHGVGSPIARVETCFFAKMAPGKWKQVAAFYASADPIQQDPADIGRMKEDPQVRQALKIIQGLANRDNVELIDIALRKGAATEQAMMKCDQDFFDFVDRYTVNTETPPLILE